MKLFAIALGAFAAVTAAAASAHAGGLKAHLECTPSGGALLKASQSKVLDKDVACAVVVDRGAIADGAKVSIWASWSTPAGDLSTSMRTASHRDQPIAAAPTGTKPVAGSKPMVVAQRYEVDAPFALGDDFRPCATVTFHAQIGTDGAKKPDWSGTVRVAGTCKKQPVPAKTHAVCAAMGKSDPVFYPGTGDKEQPPLGEGITCSVHMPAMPADPLFAVIGVKGSKDAPRLMPIEMVQTSVQAFVQLLPPTYETCKPFTVLTGLVDGQGTAVWSGKVSIKQRCKK